MAQVKLYKWENKKKMAQSENIRMDQVLSGHNIRF